MASVYNQGLMTRGYETENTPSLSSYPVISLSKTSQLTDETREEAGDNCSVFSKYPGAVLLSHDLKKKKNQETLKRSNLMELSLAQRTLSPLWQSSSVFCREPGCQAAPLRTKTNQ